MDDEIAKKLDEEIKSAIEQMVCLRVEDDNYEKATKRVDFLCRLRLDQEKLAVEQETKIVQTKNEKQDRVIKYALEAAALIVPTVVSWVWMGRGLRFEESGTYTSKTKQWVGGFVRPKK